MKVLQVTELPQDPAGNGVVTPPPGVTISAYLQPHRSTKKGGHAVVIRATVQKKHIYLPTELHAEKKEFNEAKMVLYKEEKQSKLDRCLSAAVSLATMYPGDLEAIKLRWNKVLRGIGTEKQIMGFIERHEHYALDELLVERDRLEAELAKVNEKIAERSKQLKRTTKRASATEAEKQTFQDAMQEFRITWQLLKKRDAQAWESWLNVLEEAAKEAKRPLTLQNINLEFYAAYAHYILDTRGNFDNTFGAHVKRLKSFLKFAEHKGNTVNQDFKDKRFKILEEEKEVVYLDEEEMNMLWDFKQVQPAYSKVIDLATFQNLCGFRVSDLMKTHLVVKDRGNEFLAGKCIKNGGSYRVPLDLDTRIKEILTAHGYNLAILSQAQYNKQLKVVLTLMYQHHGIEAPMVEIRPTKLGVVHAYFAPKPDEISSHSMRRSFCTRHINGSSFNQNDILAMLGSSDLTELQKYMKTETSSLAAKAQAAAVLKQ